MAVSFAACSARTAGLGGAAPGASLMRCLVPFSSRAVVPRFATLSSAPLWSAGRMLPAIVG